MAWISKNDLAKWFGEAEAGEKSAHLLELRERAGDLAALILEISPGCADQSQAIRCLRESILWAREAVLKGSGKRNEGQEQDRAV